MKHSLSAIKTLAAAKSLLSSESYHAAQVEQVLGLLGKTLDADRVSLFKLSGDSSLLHPVARWADQGISKRQQTPLVVEALEELDSGTGTVFAEAIYGGSSFSGALIIESGEIHEAFDPETREFIRNLASMLAPFLDAETDAPPPPKLSPPDEAKKPGGSGELHILIVEDDEANLFLIEKFIERFGAVSHTATNGQEAVRMCKEMKFDVILMDLTMPKLDGFDATREIVTGANLNRKTPIIAVTADVTDGIERRCKKIGMQHYIAKPIRKDTIIRALTELIKNKPKSD
ncbi:MAG TPA: response regulator [Opitutales bacterium]|nr:response regulator [Opitutales bacterium]